MTQSLQSTSEYWEVEQEREHMCMVVIVYLAPTLNHVQRIVHQNRVKNE